MRTLRESRVLVGLGAVFFVSFLAAFYYSLTLSFAVKAGRPGPSGTTARASAPSSATTPRSPTG